MHTCPQSHLPSLHSTTQSTPTQSIPTLSPHPLQLSTGRSMPRRLKLNEVLMKTDRLIIDHSVSIRLPPSFNPAETPATCFLPTDSYPRKRNGNTLRKNSRLTPKIPIPNSRNLWLFISSVYRGFILQHFDSSMYSVILFFTVSSGTVTFIVMIKSDFDFVDFIRSEICPFLLRCC